MDAGLLERILSAIPKRRIAVLGDACADIYWDADMTLSELSRETPQFPYPVVGERCSLGAGANVAANLAALGARDIRFAGLTGNDWRGQLLRGLFAERGISDRHLIAVDGMMTPAYCKPILHGISDVRYEAPRLDFISREPVSPETEDRIISALEAAVSDAELLIVCDQFPFGCVTPRVRERLGAIAGRIPVLVDSRDRLSEYRGVTVKPNELELARALGLPQIDPSDPEAVDSAVLGLSERNHAPVLATLGKYGAVWCEDGICVRVPAYRVEPPIDFVGAGDAFLAGFALARAGGLPPRDMLEFACLVPAVTIRKLGTTGTAFPDELRLELRRHTMEA